MEIVLDILKCEKIDPEAYGLSPTANITCITVEISDTHKRVSDILNHISNQSWINKLGVIDQLSFRPSIEKTIKEITKDVTSYIAGNKTISEMGEYIVSATGQDALEQALKYKKLPLPELWKEKESGNGGFDFHNISLSDFFIFGEAKYVSSDSGHRSALQQIYDFIDDENKKDDVDLRNLVSFDGTEQAAANYLLGQKGYAAAFSINAKDPSCTMETAITNDYVKPLSAYSGLYLIGVKIIK